MISLSSDVTSDRSLIVFNVYDKRHDNETSFLGTLQIKPVLINDHAVDQWYKWVDFPLFYFRFWFFDLLNIHFRLKPFETEVVTGEIRIQVTYEHLQVWFSPL